MEKNNDVLNIEDFKNPLVDELKSYTLSDWYSLFLVLFLNSSNENLDDLHESIMNGLNDAFAITSVKKRYESNEYHKRLW